MSLRDLGLGPWEATYGNIVLSCAVGNHVGLRGLPGGGKGDSNCEPLSGAFVSFSLFEGRAMRTAIVRKP
jgi:hypothetical protein